jgi:hypothetical protein
MKTVLHLDNADGRNNDLGFTLLLFEPEQQFADWLRLTLCRDQHAGVED